MKLIRLLATPFAFLVVGVIRLIAGRCLVRFGELWSPRLGHLVGNTECYLSERDAGMHKGHFDIWYPSGGPCSHPLIERKYRQRLHTLPRWFADLIVRVNRLFIGAGRHEVMPLQFDRDIKNLWERYAPHLEFTEAEERRGAKLLRSLGIPGGAKWICLIVRDSEYLKKTAPGQDFSYHDHRDSDIDNTIPAVVELARRGYYVIRMGKIAQKKLLVKHTHVIDYCFHKKQSDFGQLYLGAKCEFAFGSSTGMMAIPQAFQRPTVVVNFVPFEYIHTWLDGICIWKHHVKDGKRMTIPEIVESGAGQFMFAGQFQQAGITLEENTSQEIYAAVIEILEHPFRAAFPQYKFWDQYPLGVISNFNGKKLHGRARVRIGAEFLKGYT